MRRLGDPLSRRVARPLGYNLPSNYAHKVLAIDQPHLLAYWPLSEVAGSVAYDFSGTARHGAYTGVTLGQPGIGDGNTSPLFDGANDFVNIYTVSLRDAFNGSEGTAMIWAKVFNAGVWTDSASRYAMLLRVDVNNWVYSPRRISNNGALRAGYTAGGTQELVTSAGHAELTWLCAAITWSKSAGVNGEVKAFLNGAQYGTTQTLLGTWAGALAPTTTVIGATDTVPGGPWYGWLAHPALWDIALTQPQIAPLAVP